VAEEALASGPGAETAYPPLMRMSLDKRNPMRRGVTSASSFLAAPLIRVHAQRQPLPKAPEKLVHIKGLPSDRKRL
jgi:hypothetical protein